jgi:hypothetical protein
VTTKQTTKKYPAPVYAAAGAADLAYQALRTIPAQVAELRGKTAVPEIDVERLRGVARRNAAAVRAGAQAAQERAVAIYTDLVARGEQVVSGGVKTAQTAIAEVASNVETDAAKTAKATGRPVATKTTAAKATKAARPAADK